MWLCTHVALVTGFALECVPARTCLAQAVGVAVSGTYAYVVGINSDSLAVVDVSTPWSPTLAGSLIDATNMDGVSCCAHDVAAACGCLPASLALCVRPAAFMHALRWWVRAHGRCLWNRPSPLPIG